MITSVPYLSCKWLVLLFFFQKFIHPVSEILTGLKKTDIPHHCFHESENVFYSTINFFSKRANPFFTSTLGVQMYRLLQPVAIISVIGWILLIIASPKTLARSTVCFIVVAFISILVSIWTKLHS